MMLLAVNKEYFPTYKWMYKSLERFSIKPDNIEQRFRNSFDCSSKEAFENMLGILFETFEIIKNVYPQISLDKVSSQLIVSRIAHIKPVDI